MEKDNILTFGAPIVEADYIPRPGGYAVVVDDQKRIATVVTPKGRFLPGGAIEDGETAEQAAIRETLEETGLHIEILKHLGRSDECVSSPTVMEGAVEPSSISANIRYYRKECEFYLAKVISSDGIPIEADHALEWIGLVHARSAMTHASQAWAIDQLI